MDRKIIFVCLVLICQYHICAASLQGQLVKQSTQPDRRKAEVVDLFDATIIGAGIGSGLGPVGAAVGGAVGFVACLLFCKDDPPPPPPPPNIKCNLPPHKTYYPSEGKRTVVVTWTKPTSSDGKVTITTGYPSGTTFPEGYHSTVYSATRGIYSSPSCVIGFTVKVRKCPTPPDPDFGRVTCDTEPPIFGGHCRFECDAGYKSTGSSVQKCDDDKTYVDHGKPFSCQIKSCPTPTIPGNTTFEKESDCTGGFNYKSVCKFQCGVGYKRSRGQTSSIVCGINEKWEPAVASACKDAVPPVIHNCPENVVAYVGKDQQHAVIDYDLPTANDTLDGPVSVKLVEGYAPGTSLAIDRSSDNLHKVVYTAIDSGGLKALKPCVFTVSVADLTCPPLENQPKMNTTCSPPLYVYGSTCEFTCFSGYPLEGNETVTCEKYEDRDEVYWRWGIDNEPTKCSVQECPDLDPPMNGALGCTPIAAGKHCVMSCNEKWDVPRTSNTLGTFVCDDAQGWLDGDQVPDCTKERRPNSFNLPTEFYFKGDCSNETIIEKIKQHVITATLESQYTSRCERESDCNIENVEVTCGAVSRKRALQDIRVNFDFSVVFEYKPDVDLQEQYDKLEDQVYDMFDLFEQEVGDGLMDSEELDLVADVSSLAPGSADLVCDLGMTPNYASLTCSACPTGTMFDVESNDCIDCPIGTYQNHDAQFSCILCPEGFSTASTGSRNISDCAEMCPAGSVSNTGIVDQCYLCPMGTYQEELGQKVCLPCPEGTNSTIQGSNSLLNCKSDSDVCIDSICDTHGVCVPSLEEEGQYTCVCGEGYSGTDCSVPPDPCDSHACQLDSTCVPQSDGHYTCTCQTGFTGTFCELQIINGGWSSYEEWSTCTKSCGSGTQIRQRRCNIPNPRNGGQDCEGENFETRVCAEEECPVCPSPYRPYGGSVDVTEANDTKTAVLSCNLGTVLSDPSLSTFTCSQSTGYEWMPKLERRNYPGCTEIALAESATIDAEFRYQVPEQPDNMDPFTSGTTSLLNTSPCVVDGTCHLSVSAAVLSSSLLKRDTDITIVVYIGLNASFEYKSFFQDGEFQIETANSTVPDYVSLLAELELLMVQLQNATKDGTLKIEIDGQTYYPEADSFIVDGSLRCSEGMHSLTGFCVNCPAGHREVIGRCVDCEVGTYQDQEGQVSCITCPEGETTEATGSNSLDLCLVIDTTTAESLDTTLIPNPGSDSPVTKLGSDPTTADPTTTPSPIGGVGKLVYLAIPAVIVILAGILIGVLVYCYCQYKKRRVNPNKESLSTTGKKYLEEERDYMYTCGPENLAAHSTLDGNVILSAPPLSYWTRPATAESME